LTSIDTIIGSVKFSAQISFRQRAALDNNPVFGTTISFREDSSGRKFKETRLTEDPQEAFAVGHEDSHALSLTKS
jgi:hypothetical protein